MENNKHRKLAIGFGSAFAASAAALACVSAIAWTRNKNQNQTFTLIRNSKGWCVDALNIQDRASITTLDVPTEIDGVPVVEISKGAFKGCINLTSISLPFIGHTATSTGTAGLFGYIFGDEMYEGCGNYTWHIWSESDRYDDEEVEYANFAIPSSLRTVTVKGGSKVSAGAFSNCKYLESINIQNVDTDEIANYAFYGCMHLRNFTYPKTTKIIGRRAFMGCYNCKEITIPSTVETIKHNAYANCISATSAQVPESVTKMGKLVFDNMVYGLVKVWCDEDEIPTGWNKEWVKNTTPVVYDYAGGGIYYTKEAMVALCGKKNEQYGFIVSWLGDWQADVINFPSTFTTPDGTTYPIKRIGPNVFSQNEYVTKVNFGNNIEYISANAFEYCTKLETVNFGDSMKSIGTNAFIGCTALSKHTDADGNDVEGIYFNKVENIGMSAFAGDTGITSIEFGKEDNKGFIKTIGASAFENCYYLSPLKTIDAETSERTAHPLTFPSSLESIGEKAFYNCCRLRSSTEGKTYTYDVYGDVVFENGTNQELDIGESAFENFGVRTTDSTFTTQLKLHLNFNDIKFKDNTMKANIFKNSYLYGIYNFPQSVQKIGDYAFYNSYPYYVEEDTTSATSQTFTLSESVSEIGNYAFYNWAQIKFVMPTGESLTKIGNYSFQYCSNKNFIDLQIPDSVESIGVGAFSNCSNLRTLHISTNAKLTRLENSTFSGCTYLGIYDAQNPTYEIVVPANITYLGASVFYSCKYMCKINIKGEITNIGSSCFAYCENLINSAETIASNESYIKFSHASGLSKIVSFGSNVYQQCAGLVYAPFPTDAESKSITTIPSYTFDNCVVLTNFDILGNVTSIGESAFKNCRGISKITGMTAVKTINKNAFYNCDKLTSFGYTNTGTPVLAWANCQSIGDNAFANCTSLGTSGNPEFILPIDITQAWTTSTTKGMGSTPFIGWGADQTIYFQNANIETINPDGSIVTRWGWTLKPVSGKDNQYTCAESGSKYVIFSKK